MHVYTIIEFAFLRLFVDAFIRQTVYAWEINRISDRALAAYMKPRKYVISSCVYARRCRVICTSKCTIDSRKRKASDVTTKDFNIEALQKIERKATRFWIIETNA